MKGYEHYQEAEWLLKRSAEGYYGWNERNNLVAQAQVHATLAQTAALVHRFAPTSDETRDGWSRVLGEG